MVAVIWHYINKAELNDLALYVSSVTVRHQKKEREKCVCCTLQSYPCS